jgi:5-methylcytosine-specific restriction protein A
MPHRTKRPHRWGNPSPPDVRGYGAAHRRHRKRMLADEPFCRECREQGLGDVPARFADHIVPKCLGGTDEPTNYQPLCRDHSLSKTGREGAMMRQAKRRARERMKGDRS